jgi:hypothetical protein
MVKALIPSTLNISIDISIDISIKRDNIIKIKNNISKGRENIRKLEPSYFPI